MNFWIVNVYRRAWNVPRIEMYLSGIMGGSHFYIQVVILFICFFLLCHGIWCYGHSFICFVPFLSVRHFPVEGYQFTQQYRKSQHQQPSDVNDSKASHRRCNAKCYVHSMKNIKPQRLFLWSVFVTESVFLLSECSAAPGRWETVRNQD